jgi:hypothetical protein
MTHIYLAGGLLHRLTLCKTDVMAVPEGQSVICAEDWAALCELAGSETTLIASLGVVEVNDAIG